LYNLTLPESLRPDTPWIVWQLGPEGKLEMVHEYRVGRRVLVTLDNGSTEEGEVVYVRMDHLNDFKTVAAVCVKRYSQMQRPGYTGSVFFPSRVQVIH
jgi:hypothetical protein